MSNTDVSKVTRKGTWREVADSARTTIGMDKGKGNVSRAWKLKILLAEHSPIRLLKFKWIWHKLPYYQSVHFVRHKHGIEHYVETSRTDRTGIDRKTLKHDSPVEHECEANAQALINISRKRLCGLAEEGTREAWKMVLEKIEKVDSEVASVCVPECVYRGFCPEIKSCGWWRTQEYRDMLEKYRSLTNEE